MAGPTFQPRKKITLPPVMFRMRPSFTTVDERSMAGQYPTFNPAPQGDMLQTGEGEDVAMRGPRAPGGVNTASPPVSNEDSEQAALEERVKAYNAAHPSSPLDLAQERLKRLHTDPIKGDRIGSGLYAGGSAMADASRSGSLGRTVGAGIGGFLGGLINKKLKPSIERQQEIKQAEAEVGTAQSAEEYETNKKLKEAQTRNIDSMPTYRDQKAQNATQDATRRTLTSMYNKLDSFDPDNPEDADMAASMKAAGLPAPKKSGKKQIKIVQDPKSGEYYSIAADKATGEAQSSDVAAPGGGQLTTATPQQMQGERDAANRASREKVAQWNIASKEKIAAVQASIAQERVGLSKDALKARYPGAGREISFADVAAEGKKLNLDEEKAAAFFANKGFTLVDEYSK